MFRTFLNVFVVVFLIVIGGGTLLGAFGGHYEDLTNKSLMWWLGIIALCAFIAWALIRANEIARKLPPDA